MGEMSDGDWPVTPLPPAKDEPKADRPKPPAPPKTDEWPVRKVKESKDKGDRS